jgi:hypothetical protein
MIVEVNLRSVALAGMLVITAIGFPLMPQVRRAGAISIPRFEDYAVSEDWGGPAAPLKMTTRSEGMFRTQLTSKSKEPPNLAGHYKFAGWGCGSVCAAGAIIDLNTGLIYQPPLAGPESGWEHWMFAGGPVEGPFVESRRDSRLVIVRTMDKTAHTCYFVWEDNRFRQVLTDAN